MMRDKTPKRKKSKKKAEEFKPKDNPEIEELTQKALSSLLREQLNQKSNRKRDMDALSSTIEEFLTSYVLLGYSLQGEAITIVSAHNQQEADSLTTLVNKFLTNCMNHGNPLDQEEE
jgi:hypothetical protein